MGVMAERPKTLGGSSQKLGRIDRIWGGRGADRLWGGSTGTCFTLFYTLSVLSYSAFVCSILEAMTYCWNTLVRSLFTKL